MDDDRKELEVYELADALIRGDITAEESARLGRLIESDAQARAHYLRFMHDSAKLCRWSIVWTNSRESGEWTAGSREDGGERREGRRELYDGEPAADAPFPAPPPAILQPPSALLPTPSGIHSPPSTLHYLSGAVSLSYALAVLMLSIGVVVAWTWRQSAEKCYFAEFAATTGGRRDSSRAMIGRVTATIDCRWDASESAATYGEMVTPRRRFAIKSGFLEITFADGSGGIIAQGPATFEMESENRVLLHSGKLTACIESSGEGASQTGDTDGPVGFGVRSRRIASPPLCFVVRAVRRS